ncbi:Very-long-chain enoyl-CoA reductase [Lecanora helva]
MVIRQVGKPVNKLPEEISVPASGTAWELYNSLASQASTSEHRLRVTKGSDGAFVPNNKDLKLESTGLREQSTIYVKDLGPQIAWRTVFLVEYAGPLFIHPLVFTFLVSPQASYLQTLSLTLVCLHFLKRELETLFIHRFSSATMPAFNIFKNSAHYWVLSGLNMAYWIYRPRAPAAEASNPYITYTGLALFTIGELGNLSNHITLRNLRSSGSTERGIPQGLGFNLVTCPNYMFEAIAWAGIALVSWSLSTVIFAIAAIGQMGVWAKKKESRYRKEFGSRYSKKRYAMLPFIW